MGTEINGKERVESGGLAPPWEWLESWSGWEMTACSAVLAAAAQPKHLFASETLFFPNSSMLVLILVHSESTTKKKEVPRGPSSPPTSFLSLTYRALF